MTAMAALVGDELAELKLDYARNLEELNGVEQEIESAVPEALRSRRKAKVRYLIDNLMMQGMPKTRAVERLAADCSNLTFVRLSIATIWRELGEDEPLSTDSDKTVPPTHWEVENKMGIDIVEAWIAIMQTVIKKMKAGPWLSLMTPEQREEFLTRDPILQGLCTDGLDDRELIEQNFTVLYVLAAFRAGAIDKYVFYANVAKEIRWDLKADTKIRGIHDGKDITGKQTSKIYSLIVPKIHWVLEPTTSEYAQAIGFSGEHCPKCAKLRIRRHPDGGLMRVCVDCQHVFTGTAIKMPKTMADLKAEQFLNEVYPKWKRENNLT